MGTTHKFLSGLSEVIFRRGTGARIRTEDFAIPDLEFIPSGLYRCSTTVRRTTPTMPRLRCTTSTVLSDWGDVLRQQKSVICHLHRPGRRPPFGPHIPIGDTGVSVQITGWSNGGGRYHGEPVAVGYFDAPPSGLHADAPGWRPGPVRQEVRFPTWTYPRSSI